MASKKAKRKKAAKKKGVNRKSAKSKLAVRKKAAKRVSKKAKSKPTRKKARGHADLTELVAYGKRGIGARSAGQSGDTQGIAAGARVDSESVEELLEEGQAYEAEVVDGVEHARDPDEGEVRTRQVKEDDIPEEYRERD